MKRRWGQRGRRTRDDALPASDPFDPMRDADADADPAPTLSDTGILRVDIAFDDDGLASPAANSEYPLDKGQPESQQDDFAVTVDPAIDVGTDEVGNGNVALDGQQAVDIMLDTGEPLGKPIGEPVGEPLAEREGAFHDVPWLVTESPEVEDESPAPPAKPGRPDGTKARRSWRFEWLALLGLILIWSMVVVILRVMPPVYKSSWTIMIPGTTFGSSINLDNLATANTSVGSQYGSKAIDPKVNYKSIALSPAVLDKAAERLDIDPDDFGIPKVGLVDQTTMMMITTTADSAELAYQKSKSLYDTFHDQLDELRIGERAIKQAENEDQLASYRKAVDDALAELQAFRSTAEIVSAEQYRDLASRVGDIREKRRDAEIRLVSLEAQYEAIQRSLGMTPTEAGRILRLRQDVMLQSQSEAYAKAHAEMVELEAVLGARHPKVVHARSRSALAYQALVDRASDVVGVTSSGMLKQLMPNAQADNVVLYQELIRLEADKLGIESEMAGLDASLPKLRAQVLRYSSDASKLEELERNHQIARTILVSATSRIDLANSDIYASYPMTQELVLPTMPKKPGRLRKLFVILGGIAGSGLIFLALLVYWNRDRWRRLIQKSA